MLSCRKNSFIIAVFQQTHIQHFQITFIFWNRVARAVISVSFLFRIFYRSFLVLLVRLCLRLVHFLFCHYKHDGPFGMGWMIYRHYFSLLLHNARTMGKQVFRTQIHKSYTENSFGGGSVIIIIWNTHLVLYEYSVHSIKIQKLGKKRKKQHNEQIFCKMPRRHTHSLVCYTFIFLFQFNFLRNNEFEAIWRDANERMSQVDNEMWKLNATQKCAL